MNRRGRKGQRGELEDVKIDDEDGWLEEVVEKGDDDVGSERELR